MTLKSRDARACAIPALLVSLALTAGTAWGASVGPLVQVSEGSPFGALGDCGNFPGRAEGANFIGSEVEPWVAVNPTNPNNIVALWQQDRWSDGGSRGNVAGVSFDGGSTWQSVAIPNATDCPNGSDKGPWERASDPWVSFSPDGTLHQMSLVFQADPPEDRSGGFGRNAMVVSKSMDGGLTWSTPITLVDDANPRLLNDKNSLTADPTDHHYVYAVWDRLTISAGDAISPENVRPGRGKAYGVAIGRGFRGPIYIARSTDGGDTWEPARRVYEPGANSQTIGNQIVVQPDGAVIDFFSEILNFRNSDGGAQFDVNLALFRSTDKGASWSPLARPIRASKIISNGVVTPDDLVPVRDASILFDVAVDPTSGGLYAVWQDARFSGVDQIAFSQSTDGGFTWSTPVRIDKTPGNASPLREQAFLPSVTVTNSGIVGVTYYDFRNDNTSGEYADYWFIACDAKVHDCTQAANWDEQRLTEAPFNYLNAPFARGLFLGDYEGLAATDSAFLAIFAQPSNTDRASIYFRRVIP